MFVAALLVLGIAASALGAAAWRDSVRNNARRSFQTTAADVTSTLASSLRGDTDFVASLRAVVTITPNISNARFGLWYRELQGRQRLVGSEGSALIASVPDSGLPIFAAAFERDPTFHALTRGAYRVIPSAAKAQYCLVQAFAGAPFPQGSVRLLLYDYCSASTPATVRAAGLDPSIATTLRSGADSGRYTVTRLATSRGATLFTGSPVYRLGAPLATVMQRRAALMGWVAGSFDPAALVSAALVQHRDLAVSLYYRNPGATAGVTAHVNAAVGHPTLTRTSSVQAQGDWVISVSGAPTVAGLSANAQGLIVLVAGLMLTVLGVVLVRSRDQALRLVANKTGELRFRALHDSLTGLPNRALVLDRTEQMLARARRHNVPVAALYIDIDAFKQVNDTFGHAAGDELLVVVADRLATVMRESDTVGRLAGDEFVALLESASLEAGPELVAQRVLDALSRPIALSAVRGTAVTVSASVGIALGGRAEPELLLRDADLALYRAKQAGKNRYVLFEPEMQLAARHRLDLEFELTSALTDGQLFLMYQPIFDLQTETVTGVEALVRWRHPTRGIVPPDAFIPIAEQNGQIVDIGRWVLDQACAQAAAWHEDGHELGMSVNVSGRQLDEDNLVEDVRAALARYEIEPKTLTLEVTETTLMRDAESSARRLAELKALGVRISIDDFGTGYSSLAYLQQFPIDALKIDRSFISGIAASGASTALIHTLVQLGKTLKIETLGEGIEQQGQLRRLQREQCDLGQGFLFARPLTARGMEQFLQTGALSAAAGSSQFDG